MRSRRRARRQTSHEPALGTRLDLYLSGQASDLDVAVAWILDEFDRLEQIFSSFDPTSTLRRWTEAEIELTTHDELGHLLELVLPWQQRSGGAFNPLADRLVQFWQQAAGQQTSPDDTRLQAMVESIAVPCFSIDGIVIKRNSDCHDFTLNAIAKGHIVDRVIDTAYARFDLDSIVISAGGDLSHCGSEPYPVLIEDPNRPYDNVPPLARLAVCGQSVATSGSARRSFSVGGERLNHIIDPRTGWPATAVAQASVVAADAATADVLATILATLGPQDGIEFVSAIPDVGCLIVDQSGELLSDPYWRQHELRSGR